MFARAGSDEQSQLINNMGLELYVACKGSRGFETQCCYLSDGLDESGKRFIKEVYEFIKLRDEVRDGD